MGQADDGDRIGSTISLWTEARGLRRAGTKVGMGPGGEKKPSQRRFFTRLS
jgi:hypothetical protein